GATSAIKTNTNRVEIPLTETSGTIPLPAGNNRVTLVAKYNGLGDLDATARTVNIDWLQDLSAASRFTASPTAAPGVLSYSLTATNPPADSYTLYYLQTSGNETAQQIIDDPETNTLPITPGDDRTIDLEQGGKNRFVVVARYAGLNDTISRVQTADFDTIFVKTSIQESIINTVVSWSFENEAGTPFNPVGDITLTYTYSGLAIAGGTLTTNIISGNESITLASNVRQHTIIHNDLIEITDIVVSTIFGSEPVDSAPINSSNIELRLYNMAYAKASEYGAVEMFSHGRAAPVSLGPTTQARAHTIINYDSSGNPVNLYGATFSRGHGGLSGSADATNLREWHYDGEFLYGRSNGGNTNIVDGTDATGAVTPSTVADRWADRNSILAGHTTTIWAAFHNRFRQDPFNFIPYDINNGFDSLHEFMFTDPTTIGNNLTSGRSSAPEGLIRTTTNGALSHRNGMFQFSILMNGDRTGNRVNIQWSGDVTMTATGYAHSTITFFIDENFRFVKYHAFDRYTVTLLSATTSVQATMYFVYHENNIDLNNHATYRAHQIRPTHVNYCDCVNCDEFIAPNGNIADGSWVVANSRYPITLDWIENANAASKVSIPRP
ncbi:MAG: hypothetical protein FWD36_00585, partial [Treponema sp.]|nr:hypothetical protein [Treponema sp.]